MLTAWLGINAKHFVNDTPRSCCFNCIRFRQSSCDDQSFPKSPRAATGPGTGVERKHQGAQRRRWASVLTAWLGRMNVGVYLIGNSNATPSFEQVQTE